MLQKFNASVGSQKHQEPKKLGMDTTVSYPEEPLETCSCKIALHDLLLTYSDASTISKRDLLSLFITVSLAGLETIAKTAAVIDLLTIIQYPDFDVHPIKIQV